MPRRAGPPLWPRPPCAHLVDLTIQARPAGSAFPQVRQGCALIVEESLGLNLEGVGGVVPVSCVGEVPLSVREVCFVSQGEGLRGYDLRQLTIGQASPIRDRCHCVSAEGDAA